MKVINPSVELWVQGNTKQEAMEHVAKCASVCYASSEKTGDKAAKFYKALISSGHVSMLRHESCYYIIETNDIEMNQIIGTYYDSENPYISIKCLVKKDDSHNSPRWAISTNANFVLNNYWLQQLDNYQVTIDEFKKVAPEFMRYTFCLTTQISTARELNRVSPNNIAEMSTRYISFGGKVEPTICKPHWLMEGIYQKGEYWENDCGAFGWNVFNEELGMHHDVGGDEGRKANLYLKSCRESFNRYTDLMKIFGVKQEDARGILPLDTMTKVIYTYTIREWENILKLRMLGTTGRPHPNAKLISSMVYDELQKLGYKFTNVNPYTLSYRN